MTTMQEVGCRRPTEDEIEDARVERRMAEREEALNDQWYDQQARLGPEDDPADDEELEEDWEDEDDDWEDDDEEDDDEE